MCASLDQTAMKSLTLHYMWVYLIQTELLTGISVRTPDDAILACRDLQSRGCSRVIITMGEMGCVVATPGDSPTTHVTAPSDISVVDTTVSSLIGS